MNVRDLFSEAPSGLGFSLRREEVSEYFKIDGETRVITPPTDFKNFGVESDENSKRVWFEAPRIVGDEIDLSTLNLYVNYKNANGEVDKYYVDDVEVVDDKIYFSWKLERKPVRYKGTLTFIVCAVATDSKGVIQTEWNTTLCTGQVLEGLEVETPEIPVEESDIINQLIDLVRTTSEKAVADVEAAKAEAIASIETAGSPIFANALKATASGEVVRVDDVSPLGHMARAKVSGKNKYYAHATRELSMSGVIISMEEKKSQFTIDGTATNEFSFTCGSDIVLTKGTYTVSVIGLNANGVDRLYLTDISEKTIFANFIYPNTPKTVVMDTDAVIRVKGVLAANSVYENGSVLIQIEKGNTATEYEPFVDPTTVTVTRCGKNLFDSSKLLLANGWSEENGVYSGDSSALYGLYSLSQGSTVATGFKPATQYILTLDAYADVAPDKPIGNTFRFQYDDGTYDSVSIDTTEKTTYSLVSAAGKTVVGVYVSYGHDITTYLSNLQIEEGNTTTGFEPYKGETFTPSEDGTVNIPSLSPTMTLLTDTVGVNIDLEYNRDINVALDTLIQTINTMAARLFVRTVSVSLLASKWEETDGIYSQVVTIADTTPYSKVDLQPSVEQLTVFYEKDISFATENEGGVITVYCVGQKPTNDYVMQATITEVNVNG